jgi:hypothetical protein
LGYPQLNFPEGTRLLFVGGGASTSQTLFVYTSAPGFGPIAVFSSKPGQQQTGITPLTRLPLARQTFSHFLDPAAKETTG